MASLDDFLDLELRTGTIVSAEVLRGARTPTLALRIDFGERGVLGGTAEITDLYEVRPEKIMFIKGDPKVQYQDVIYAMDVSRGAGVKVIGIPPKDTQ